MAVVKCDILTPMKVCWFSQQVAWCLNSVETSSVDETQLQSVQLEIVDTSSHSSMLSKSWVHNYYLRSHKLPSRLVRVRREKRERSSSESDLDLNIEKAAATSNPQPSQQRRVCNRYDPVCNEATPLALRSLRRYWDHCEPYYIVVVVYQL